MLDSRLRLFGKPVARLVAMNTDGLIHLLFWIWSFLHYTHSHPYWCLQTSIHCFKEQYVIAIPWIDCLYSRYNLSCQSPVDISAVYAMHPSGNGQNPLLGTYRSAKVQAVADQNIINQSMFIMQMVASKPLTCLQAWITNNGMSSLSLSGEQFSQSWNVIEIDKTTFCGKV